MNHSIETHKIQNRCQTFFLYATDQRGVNERLNNEPYTPDQIASALADIDRPLTSLRIVPAEVTKECQTEATASQSNSNCQPGNIRWQQVERLALQLADEPLREFCQDVALCAVQFGLPRGEVAYAWDDLNVLELVARMQRQWGMLNDHWQQRLLERAESEVTTARKAALLTLGKDKQLWDLTIYDPQTDGWVPSGVTQKPLSDWRFIVPLIQRDLPEVEFCLRSTSMVARNSQLERSN